MARNGNTSSDLSSARTAKKDEFYTQYEDIEKEMNAYIEFNKDVFCNKIVLCPCDDPEWSNFTKYFAANFERLGIKKLISTSYVKSAGSRQLTLLEKDSPKYNEKKHDNNGKLFILDRDIDGSGHIDSDDIQFEYLDGDGDFRSEEVSKLLEESDIVVTNPPFSLFRDFIKWIMNAKKKFIIIGNINCATYKEVFPLIKDNLIWLGATIHSGDRKFYVPDDYPLEAAGCGIDEEGKRFIRVKGVRWYTNIDHEYRHEPLKLMTMNDNLKYNKKLLKKLLEKFSVSEYPYYDGYEAIEVPFTEAIPDDFTGIMGVPITFLDKYCPTQFTILGLDRYTMPKESLVGGRAAVNGKSGYARVLIKKISVGDVVNE